MAVALPTYTKHWHNDVYPSIDASRPELSAKGKRVIITGGAGGIGAATAEAFIIAGARQVVILGRTSSTLEATKTSITSNHKDANIIAIVADVASEASIESAFEEIKSLGTIDIFINNAGYFPASEPLRTVDASDFWKGFQINVLGSFYATQHAVKNMTSTGGVLINVATAASHAGFIPGYGPYAISKAATWKMFEWLAGEERSHRIYNVQPGIIEATSLASKSTAQTGISWPQQDAVELPANFMVWLSSDEGVFLKGRFLWANWDVDELKAKKAEFERNENLLTMGLLGWQ